MSLWQKNLIGVLLKGARAGDRHLAMRDPRFREAPIRIHVTSPDFGAWAMMPQDFTQDGQNLSPPLKWENLPDEARSMALIVQDPDAPTPDPLTHLIAYDIAPDDEIMTGDLMPGQTRFSFGKGSFGRVGYTGPRPIRSHGRHRYMFQLFALDQPLIFDKIPDLRAMLDAMAGHVVARGELTGWYERN